MTIYAIEDKGQMDMALVDPRVLKTTQEKRDQIALKLEKDKYIEGLRIIDGIDGQREPVIMWEHSNPKITIKGLEYIDGNDSMKNAVKEIKDIAISIAAQAVTNVIMTKM